MLLGKWDADDGDGKEEGPGQVCQSNAPSKEDQPDQIEDDAQCAIGIRVFNDLSAKGRESGETELDRLDPKRDTNDRQAHEKPTNDIAHPCEKTTENQPDDIA